MFQAWLVKIANTEAHSRPSMDPGKSTSQIVSVTDRNASTGTDCRMSSRGMRIFSARRDRAATVAYAKVNSSDARSAANMRRSERSA